MKKRVIIFDEKKKLSDEEMPDEETEEIQDESLSLEEQSPKEDDPEDTGEEEYDIFDNEDSNIVYGSASVRKKRRKKHTKRNKHLLILLISFALLIVVGIASFNTVNNTYETPVKVYERYLNKAEYSGQELSEAYGNGVALQELRLIRGLLNGSGDHFEGIGNPYSSSQELYLENCQKYGENFRYTVKIDSVSKLSGSELDNYRLKLSGIVSDIENSSIAFTDNTELTEAVNAFGKEMENSGITHGYDLKCSRYITGETVDGPVSTVEPFNCTVLKVNGRWIMWDKIYDILRLTY
ncbi:MAG: hypothetical protein K6E98_11245 [Lachnospiraceae bacterium]|nr:hypothetical protein [Lachnospiraceae bacterium]